MFAQLTLALLHAAPDETLALIDDRPITASQVVTRVAETQAAGGVSQVDALVEDLINEELMASAGAALHLTQAPAVIAATEAAQRKAAAERFLEKELYGTLKVEEAQVKMVFHETQDRVRLKLIALASEPEAKAALDRLEKGAKFEAEALHSLDPSAKRGGDLGELSRAQVDPKLVGLAFSAPLGRIQGPVPLTLGVGLVVVVSRTVADEALLEPRKAQLTAFVAEQSKVVLRKHYLEQMRARYKVTLDEAFLKATGSRNEATPEEAAHVLAQVGARSLRYGEVLASLQRTFGTSSSSHVSGLSVKRELAWSAVDHLVTETAAIEAGYGRDPQVQAKVREAERTAVIRELAARWRASAPSPTAVELQAFIATHEADYRRPGTRLCSHLLLKTPAQAAELGERIGRGARLEDLAAEYSADRGSASRGGLLGLIDDVALAAIGQKEPALAAALAPPRPNEVSPPVQSRDGWHLVRCGPVTPPHLATLAEVEGEVAARVRVARGQEAVAAQLAVLRSRAKITRDAAAAQRVARAINGASR
jgi:parvulin-like peptidyl-prolyl isomerase